MLGSCAASATTASALKAPVRRSRCIVVKLLGCRRSVFGMDGDLARRSCDSLDTSHLSATVQFDDCSSMATTYCQSRFNAVYSSPASAMPIAQAGYRSRFRAAGSHTVADGGGRVGG